MPDTLGFNEAAGIPPRKTPKHSLKIIAVFYRFNEAAGIPRGRLRIPPDSDSSGGASMRPRVFPAEDNLQPTQAHSVDSVLQ